MGVGAQTYTEFSQRLHQSVVRAQIPIDVTLELTRRCPLTCSHCYNNLPMADREARQQELTTDEYRRLLDQLAEMGCLWLLLTGGEILARQDFLEIYQEAKRRGFLITLFTNGTLITARLADALVEWHPFAIEITLYGRTRETYERLTQIPGSYDRCLQGIRLLKERDLPLLIKTVAVRVNQHEIRDMKQFVEEELGLPFKFDAMMTPRIDCSQSPLEMRLGPEEIVKLDLDDAGRRKEWKTFSEGFIRPQQPAGHEHELYHCGGAVNAFAVDPAGRMSLCILSHRDTFDLRTGTVSEGWQFLTEKVRRRKITRVTKCTACQLKSVCGMCPANAELEAGDPETPVDFLCHVAHLRALTLGWPIPAHGSCEYCPGGERHEALRQSAAALGKRREGEIGARIPLPLAESAGPRGCPSGCSCGHVQWTGAGERHGKATSV
jgi:radical SAM protein with 4Fe4S-binding SPASM domain